MGPILPTIRINAQSPWPWLDPYTEDASDFFQGRDTDADILLRGVLASPACVLFGKSGQGKTSLLQAGLAPRLRQQRLLPVVVRLNYAFDRNDARLSVSRQLIKRLAEETEKYGIAWRSVLPPGVKADNPRDQLWEWLHDSSGVWRDQHHQRWQPVFILDQFEEVFTRLTEDFDRQAVFHELGDLLENRCPSSVGQRIQSDSDLSRRIELDQHPYRFLLTLREDFLPDLEQWTDLIPRLGPNRCRLQPMTRQQAHCAIRTTGAALIDDAGAEQILDYLLVHQHRQPHNDRRKSRRKDSRQIDPVMLSLLCSGLNEERLNMTPPQERLQLSNLERSGERILEQFYNKAFAAVPQPERWHAQQFVQQHLITEDGVRRPYPLAAAAAAGMDEGTRQTLERLRLLRVETVGEVNQIELVHDRLALVAMEQRRQAEAVSEQRRRAKAVALQRRTLAWITGGLLLVIIALSLVLHVELNRQKEKRRLTEHSERAIAEQQRLLAQETFKLAVAKRELQQQNAAALQARTRADAATWRATEAMALQQFAAGLATDAALRARRAESIAKNKTTEVTILRLAIEGGAQSAGDGEGENGNIQGLLMVLAAYRLASHASGEIKATTYNAIEREMMRFAPLIELNQHDRHMHAPTYGAKSAYTPPMPMQTNRNSTSGLWPILDSWADILCTKLDKNMSNAQWRTWVSRDIAYMKQCPKLPLSAN